MIYQSGTVATIIWWKRQHCIIDIPRTLSIIQAWQFAFGKKCNHKTLETGNEQFIFRSFVDALVIFWEPALSKCSFIKNQLSLHTDIIGLERQRWISMLQWKTVMISLFPTVNIAWILTLFMLPCSISLIGVWQIYISFHFWLFIFAVLLFSTFSSFTSFIPICQNISRISVCPFC